jgi:DNA-binding NtrC family response regulator
VRPLFSSRNRAAADLAGTLARIAQTSLPVLLEGETGTGKTFIARALHRRGRSGRPLVVVDCGALPETLLAAELFGHRAGAFTDATRAREGWLSRAGAGTVVLERIDALPATGQVALLRVLEDGTFYPVGTVTAMRLGARVVATAAAGLAERMREGSFRSDLFHRLAGLHALLPALRHRPEDIVPFARATVRRITRRSQSSRVLAEETERFLAAYPWPGNFRELETALERGCLVAAGERIAAVDLGLPAADWPEIAALAAQRDVPVHEVTRLYGLFVLARHGGNVSRAARSLGVSRRTLIRWRRSP